MLRAFLSRRGSLVRRPHVTPGDKSNAIRCASDSSPSPPIRTARINLWSARTWVETVAPSLQTFLTLEKHLMVPLKFVVPYRARDWPEKAWGYPLGMHCRNLRVLKQQKKKLPFFALDDLDALDFPWDMRQHKWEVLVLPALRRFYEINGHSDIPNGFVVPTGDAEWSKVLWGFNLGQTVMSMRYANTYKAQRESSQKELDEIGFSTQSWRERMWDAKIFPALETFKHEFGHCNVNFNFVVPDSAEWPRASRGMRLGATVANIRCRSNYDDLVNRDREKLETLGFVWNPEDDRWTFRIMPAFETYSKLHGTGWIPNDFVVPYADPWPEETRGLKLGNVFMKIRHSGAYTSYVERDRERLDALGIDFNVAYSVHT